MLTFLTQALEHIIFIQTQLHDTFHPPPRPRASLMSSDDKREGP